MLTETVLEDARWQDAGLDSLAETAARAVLDHLGLDPEAFEIAVLGCDDSRIAELNTEFRDKPVPTNVLSWPSEERGADAAGDAPELPEAEGGPFATELGDIAISLDTCLREAHDLGKPVSDHVTHLLVHGTLHLLGYDHVRDADATLMEALETEILGKLGVADPYSQD
ncbi:rRNA maturation RNase YbeY [Salipiger sp.]|uniref:rRNA maturation RNase YbeY n=1 Tax=Salipiger sp. TaxID=2078585 RepID=UPI003A97829D